MFKDSFIKPVGDFKIKAMVFPLSLTTHVLIILLLIVIPLTKTGRLPMIEPTSIINVRLFTPPPAPPPGGDPGDHKRSGTKIKPVPGSQAPRPGQLIAPARIPDELVDAPYMGDGGGPGVPGGDPNGVPGGVPGGDPNAVIDIVNREIIRSPEEPIRATGEMKAPRLVSHVDPVYPEIARQARVEGVVIIEATTDIRGYVQNVSLLRSIPLLDQAAIDAVRQWIYEPMVVNGRPRAVVFTVTVRFQLR